MKQIKLNHTELTASAVVMGTDSLGSLVDGYLSCRLLDYYSHMGGNVIDTAECYAYWTESGRRSSEILIGKWMKERKNRHEMILSTKGGFYLYQTPSRLSEQEIFSKHILKNASIPIVHGIPASVLYAMTGAIITERVYVVPGAGNLLTTAINQYDNGVIVGVTLFYALLSVVSIILGDILMATVDPRISFTSKAR